MSTRKTTLFYALLIAVASVAVGMVIASRLDLSPASSAQTVAAPPMNSAPLGGPVDAATFRNIAKAVSPAVVNIRSTSKQRVQEMTEFFGGGGGGGNDDLRLLGQFRLQVQGAEMDSWIDVSHDLINWEPLTNVSSSSASITLSFPIAIHPSATFYRIRPSATAR